MTTSPATDQIETLVEDVMMLASDYRDARQGSEHRMTQSQLEKAIRSLIVAAPRALAPDAPTMVPPDVMRAAERMATPLHAEEWRQLSEQREILDIACARLNFALQTIATLPIPEQDNMVAANMRAIAVAAIEFDQWASPRAPAPDGEHDGN